MGKQASEKRAKTRIVIKKRAPGRRGGHVDRTRLLSGHPRKQQQPRPPLIPSAGLPAPPASAAVAAAVVDFSVQETPTDRQALVESYDDTFAPPDNIPNDTFLTLLALQADPATRIAIPLLHSAGTQHEIYGVLEHSLHDKLATDNAQVSRELATLQRQHQVRVLRGHDDLHVIVTAADYVRAVRQIAAVLPHSTAPMHDGALLEWFVQQLPQWSTASRLTRTDVERAWRKQPHQNSTTMTLDAAMVKLQAYQVVLPDNSNGTFQFWLPRWGVVLQAWNKAIAQVTMSLKQTYHKERLQSTVTQPYSPIPTQLVIQWMVQRGQLETVERPAGTFVRLPRE